MFFTYLRRELRRRTRQAMFIALGLAVGIGLVITVTAVSAGVARAQKTVLHSLYGVGTGITVTEQPKAGSGGPAGFRIRGPGGPVGFGRKPAPGSKFTRDTLIPDGPLSTLPASDVTAISHLPGVARTAGALSLNDLKISGRIPAGGTASGPIGITPSSFTVNGVQVPAVAVGPLSSATLTSGRSFRASDASANVAMLDSNYARQKKLKTGSAIKVAGKTFTVIGIVSQPQGGSPASVYIPLARAQALSGSKDKVNTIYVSASSSAQIPAVSKAISAAVPSATVTTSSDLASEVTGSLANAASLARNLGKWLSIAVLAAAFLVAGLLSMSAVTRRVREFGTLKALGWRSGRVIGQVVGESLAIGALGGLIGIALGFAGSALVSALAPPLTASLGLIPGLGGAGPQASSGGPGSGRFASEGPGAFRAFAGNTVTVHLAAPVTLGVVLLAVALAIAGGLVAGSFGGWRAARLRPAAALARVG